jgi:spore maturation protein SpmB
MTDEAREGALARARGAVKRGARDGAKTIWFLLRIIVPITLFVNFLGWLGALEAIAKVLAPAMGLIGLPGDAALVFISGALLNNYSAIAVAGSLALTMREAAILAIMCLTAHNLVVETQVMRKSGSSGMKMVLLRVGAAILMGWIYNRILPASLSRLPFAAAAAGARPEFWGMILAWLLSTAKLGLKIVVIVLGIMVAQRLLEEFKVMDFLSRLFAPLMKLFGLPASASFLWIVINVVGYAYGAGIIAEQIESGRMKPQEGDLFNHHAGMCHSLIEDTTLFLAVGVPLFWLLVPRLVLSSAVVWLERGRRHWVRRSFRVGVS